MGLVDRSNTYLFGQRDLKCHKYKPYRPLTFPTAPTLSQAVGRDQDRRCIAHRVKTYRPKPQNRGGQVLYLRASSDRSSRYSLLARTIQNMLCKPNQVNPNNRKLISTSRQHGRKPQDNNRGSFMFRVVTRPPFLCSFVLKR